MAEKTLVIRDVSTEPDFSDADRQALAGVQTAALIGAALRHGPDRPIWMLVAASTTPRQWSHQQIQLVEEVAERTWSAVEQARAEAALRESEERQAFLLKLSDAIRDLEKPAEVQTEALRLLAEHMGLSRAAYSEIDEDQDRARRVATYDRDLPPVPRDVRISDFSADQLACYLEGGTFMVADTETDDRVAATREACGAIQVRAWIGVPIVKGGRLLTVLGVEKMTPHAWTSDEVELVQEVAERTWAASERGHAEAALRESEERFRQFAKASSAGLWIRDANTLKMEFVSPAIGTIYGVEADSLLGDVRSWAAAIVPEDRDTALEHLELPRRGKPRRSSSASSVPPTARSAGFATPTFPWKTLRARCSGSAASRRT